MYPIPRHCVEGQDIHSTFLLLSFHINSSASTLDTYSLCGGRGINIWVWCEYRLCRKGRWKCVSPVICISVLKSPQEAAQGVLHFQFAYILDWDTAAGIIPKPTAHIMGPSVLVTKPKRPWLEWKSLVEEFVYWQHILSLPVFSRQQKVPYNYKFKQFLPCLEIIWYSYLLGKNSSAGSLYCKTLLSISSPKFWAE